MDHLYKLFRRKNRGTQSRTRQVDRRSGEWEDPGYTDHHEDKSKTWLSKESLASTDSGIAYRRHPEDRKSFFSRPNSIGTSVACYGKYSSLEHLEVNESHEDLILFDQKGLSKSLESMEEIQSIQKKELSQSLASLERIESIQKKRLEVTRHRRKYMKSNKRRRREADDEFDARFCQSMIEIPQPYHDADMDQLIQPQISVTVLRKSSIQSKSWEIRRQRKMMMKKRRSGQYAEVYLIPEDRNN